MKNRKELEEYEIAARKEKASTTIGAVGDGYQQ